MKEYNFKINGGDFNVSIDTIEDGIAKVAVNGKSYKVELGEEMKPKSNVKPVHVAPSRYQATPKAPASDGTPVKSPLPGVIIEQKVNVGDTVKAGQTILILEAMKMENDIEAPIDGVVKSINKGKGDSVLEGDVLIIIA